MNWLRRIVAIAHKEVRQLRRDCLTIGMIVGLPTLQLLLFGYAINQDVRHLRAGACRGRGGVKSATPTGAHFRRDLHSSGL